MQGNPRLTPIALEHHSVRQTAVGFKSKGLSLEGVLATPQDVPGPHPALLVCHPHPKLGGNMENPLVTTICRAAADEGVASFRFNFRGVGESEGEFDDGEGEQQDVRSALDLLKRWPGLDGKRLAVVGYSFGASAVLNAIGRLKAARCFALIAPSLSSARAKKTGRDKRPRLFVVGQRDGLVPSVELQRALDDMRSPANLYEVPGADHGLVGHEMSVARRVIEFVNDNLK